MDTPVSAKNFLNVKDLASYCYSCSDCDVVCPTKMLGIFSPRYFLFQLKNQGEADLDAFVKKAKLFNCITCNQCQIYCPMSKDNEGINFAEIIQKLRTYGFNKNLIQEQLEGNKTHDHVMQLFPKIQSESDTRTNKIDFITADSQLKIAQSGDVAFFPGCAAVLEDAFYSYGIKYTDIARSVIKILNIGGIVPVVLENKCCGHDNYWMGDVETARKLAQFNVDLYNKAGVKTIVVECAEGYRMWKYDYPKLVNNCNFEVKHLSEFILERKILPKLRPLHPFNLKITYHDPCRMGRLGGHLYDAPRTILLNLPKVELLEMENIRDDANCCGISVFKACNTTTKRLRENRVQEAIQTKAEYLITTCPKCITHFSCYLNETDDKGEEIISDHKLIVLDFATFIAKYCELL